MKEGPGDKHGFAGRDNGERVREREEMEREEMKRGKRERERRGDRKHKRRPWRKSGRRWRKKGSPGIWPGPSQDEGARATGPGPGELPDLAQAFPATRVPTTAPGLGETNR